MNGSSQRFFDTDGDASARRPPPSFIPVRQRSGLGRSALAARITSKGSGRTTRQERHLHARARADKPWLLKKDP